MNARVLVNPMPERIQLRRTKGWRMPEGAVHVSRPFKWGNPWVMRPAGTAWRAPLETLQPIFSLDNDTEPGVTMGEYFEPEARYWVIAGYWDHLRGHPDLIEAARAELAGKDLACWCKPGAACHADVLLAVANTPTLEAAYRQARSNALPGDTQ